MYTVCLLPLVLLLGTGCESKSEDVPCGDGYVKDASGRCEPVSSSDDTAISSDDTGPDDEDTGTPSHPRVQFGDVQACEDPQEAVRYEEVGDVMGFAPPSVYRGEHAENGAVAVADFDKDGDLDVVIASAGEPPVLYDREGDSFERSLLPGDIGPTQLGMADLDNDDRLDLFTGGFVPQVILNKETGWEAIDFPVSPFGDESSVTKSIHPADIDRDGVMDAYVLMSARDVESTNAALDYVAWGIGDGTFVQDTTQVPEEWGYQKGFDAQWMDWDADGWLDMYVLNELPLRGMLPSDRSEGNFLLRNNEGTLELVNEECACAIRHDGMGAALGDFNLDGLPDLYLAATSKNLLLQQLPDLSYVEVGQTTGADSLDGSLESMAWGAIFADFDNDGLPDVAVAEGDLWHEFTDVPVVMDMGFNVMKQMEPGQFEMVNETYGFGQQGSWRTVVAADHNGDGLLDFVVGDVEHRPILLMSQGCTANGWFEVDAPFGSRVEVDAGGRTHTGWAITASSFGGVVEPVVHFGLGLVDRVDAVRVTLPDGADIEINDAIMARRRIVVR